MSVTIGGASSAQLIVVGTVVTVVGLTLLVICCVVIAIVGYVCLRHKKADEVEKQSSFLTLPFSSDVSAISDTSTSSDSSASSDTSASSDQDSYASLPENLSTESESQDTTPSQPIQQTEGEVANDSREPPTSSPGFGEESGSNINLMSASQGYDKSKAKHNQHVSGQHPVLSKHTLGLGMASTLGKAAGLTHMSGSSKMGDGKSKGKYDQQVSGQSGGYSAPSKHALGFGMAKNVGLNKALGSSKGLVRVMPKESTPELKDSSTKGRSGLSEMTSKLTHGFGLMKHHGLVIHHGGSAKLKVSSPSDKSTSGSSNHPKVL